jgi:hypothetical protein
MFATKRKRRPDARADAPAAATDAVSTGPLPNGDSGKTKSARGAFERGGWKPNTARVPNETTIAIATITKDGLVEDRASPRSKKTARRTTSDADAVSCVEAEKETVGSTARVYVLTYFFSSLTIDKQKFAGVPYGWLGSTLSEWLGFPICHSNVQIQNLFDPSDVAEFGFEGGDREGTGVYQCAPGCNPHLAFARQQKCFVGETRLSHSELVEVVEALRNEWTSASYHLLTRNCNHFCDALVRRVVPGKKAPAYINRGARFLAAAPVPGLFPKLVTACLPSGGSWTEGRVCAMASGEREQVGIRDFHEWRDWDDRAAKSLSVQTRGSATGDARMEKTKARLARLDPLAAHVAPVPLLGERSRSWAI